MASPRRKTPIMWDQDATGQQFAAAFSIRLRNGTQAAYQQADSGNGWRMEVAKMRQQRVIQNHGGDWRALPASLISYLSTLLSGIGLVLFSGVVGSWL